MRLLIIRHADPDYVHDSLTPTGHEEATYLAAYLRDVTIDHAYVSPMGRAQLTAAYTLADQGMGATTLEWLHEFGPNIRKPSSMLVPGCAWDWLPEDWTQREIFYTEKWYEEPTMQKYGVGEEYLRVCACFDELLARHGYRRAGKIYQVEQANHDTIALFCHYGPALAPHERLADDLVARALRRALIDHHGLYGGAQAGHGVVQGNVVRCDAAPRAGRGRALVQCALLRVLRGRHAPLGFTNTNIYSNY